MSVDWWTGLFFNNQLFDQMLNFSHTGESSLLLSHFSCVVVSDQGSKPSDVHSFQVMKTRGTQQILTLETLLCIFKTLLHVLGEIAQFAPWRLGVTSLQRVKVRLKDFQCEWAHLRGRQLYSRAHIPDATTTQMRDKISKAADVCVSSLSLSASAVESSYVTFTFFQLVSGRRSYWDVQRSDFMESWFICTGQVN